MTRVTKQGVRDLNDIGGAPRAWPRQGRAVPALERCLASETHRMVMIDQDRLLFGGVMRETWQCPVCGTVDIREIEPVEYGF